MLTESYRVSEKKKKERGRWKQNEGKKGNSVTMQLNSSNEVRHQLQWKQYHYMRPAPAAMPGQGGLLNLPNIPLSNPITISLNLTPEKTYKALLHHSHYPRISVAPTGMKEAGGVEGPPHGKSWASALTETCRHQKQAISEQVYTTLDSSPLENNEEL